MHEEVAEWKPNPFLCFIEKLIMFVCWGIVACFSLSIILAIAMAAMAAQHMK